MYIILILADFARLTSEGFQRFKYPVITLNEEQARKDLVDVARLSYSRDYICGTEGNFSVRLDAETLLTTPRGVCKGSLTVSDLVVTNLDGHLTANGQMTSRLPSTELPMHLAVYRLRPDVRAVVHAHPTTAVAFTVAGKSLTRCLLPEAILALGNIPVAPYATPSTQEVPDSIEACVRENNVVMLDHHGALCYADTIWDAFYLLETLEHHAKTFLIAELLGGAKPLQKGAVEKLFDICSIYGMKVPANSAELLKGDRVSHNSTFINPVTNKSAPANSNHTSMQGSNSGLLKDKIDNLKNKLDTMKNG